MSMTIFMWAVLLMLAYICFVVTNHSNTGDKQAAFLADKISGLKYEIQDIKQGCIRAVRDSADEQHERMRDVFDEVQDSVNKIKEMGEINHRWIMVNHTLISKIYRLSAAIDNRTHSAVLDMERCIDGFSEHWVNEESWQESTDIIRKNGFDAADDFIKKVNEE